MAILPIEATPPSSLTSLSSIELVQEVAARETELSLTNESNADGLTVADVSLTGQLLSSVAEISDAANAADTGASIDNEAVIDEAQRFVDSFNALNQSGQLSTDAFLDIAAEAPVVVGTSGLTAQETEAPGIDIVALGNDQANFVLTLDSDALETALETDAATATSQLAALATPVAETVATELAQATQALAVTNANTTQFELTAANTPTINVTTSQTEALQAASTAPVVPDLAVENAQLREALADSMLVDIVNMAAGITSTQTSSLTVQNTSVVAPETPQVQTMNTTAADAQSQAATNTDTTLANSATVSTVLSTTTPLNGTANPFPTAETTAAQVEAVLTPADFVTTPLEQVAQLAGNPTVAGAVAAFQIPVDESNRLSRIVPPSGLEAINPSEAVAAVGAIGPNLANNSDQRRDNSPNARVNQWLATRPGLI